MNEWMNECVNEWVGREQTGNHTLPQMRAQLTQGMVDHVCPSRLSRGHQGQFMGKLPSNRLRQVVQRRLARGHHHHRKLLLLLASSSSSAFRPLTRRTCPADFLDAEFQGGRHPVGG